MQIRYQLGIQRPAVVTMVDHEPGLTAVDADILAGDETGFTGCQEQYHVGDVQGKNSRLMAYFFIDDAPSIRNMLR